MIIARKYEFSAAHRLPSHQGKCRNLHGHNYTVELSLRGELTTAGMVIDFGDIDKRFGAWVDENLDHAAVLASNDPVLQLWSRPPLLGQKVFATSGEPTAEVIAATLLKIAENMFGARCDVCVTVWETDRCSATAVQC